MMVVWLAVTLALTVLMLTALLNTLTFPRLRARQPDHTPSVSILIPARDEAAVIGATIQRLLKQRYPDYEILVLDDHSSDGTAQVARDTAGNDPRVRVLAGEPLPVGWAGKNWACHQLAAAAQGEVLVFTDADVRWEPDALPGVVALLEQQRAGMLTVWPTQETRTGAERLVVPLMSMAIIAYLPEIMVRLSPWSAFAAANGQCLVFRREAYLASGTHEAVLSDVVEDVALARRAKRAGQRLVMVDGSGLVGCRMYTGWNQVRDGFAKNILAGHGNSLVFLALSTVFHWSVFIAPWVWLALGGWVTIGPLWPGWALILVSLGIGVRALSAAVTRQRLVDALLIPVSTMLMTIIAARSAWWRLRHGGPQWKGRVIKPA
ncbi:MAG: glycosyltransferase [Chloroflexi bacterium]|nr:glycosyltransferase [Chloroflexota bacterium]